MIHLNFLNRIRTLATGLRITTILVLIFSTFGPIYATPVYADKLVCGIPGKDGPASLNGIVNTYYPGTANVSATATSIPVGAPSGSGAPIQAGDLLLVIQMQGADINSTNTDAYGNGVAGAPASGILGTNFSAGLYEYVVATSAVVGGSVSISSGLVNNYFEQDYPVGVGNQGQRRFQVIRVPQYSSATLASTVTALAWNGSVGGVAALDVTGTLNLNGNTINVSGQGFRGGGGIRYSGGTGSATDYVTLSTNQANASKAEGTAGTPRLIYTASTVIDRGASQEGYPNGSFARGAPGNAGGGGTDGNPADNDENTGGGGGGNGGAGGDGGFAWDSVDDSGGFGGAAFSASPARLVMGGGGGAGTIDDNNGVLSSGAAGGGIVMVRAGTVSGAGTINASGSDAPGQTLNDSGGGGGAGGSVLILAANGNLPAGLNVNVLGGDGGDAWPGQAPGPVYPGARHGPGGGGGGGVIYLSSTAGTLSVAGGQNGISTTANDNYGSEPGLPGVVATVTPTSVTTGISGAECIPHPTVVKTTSTPIVTQTPTGTTGQYTIVTSVPADEGTALGFSISDVLPTGFTYDSTVSVTPLNGAIRTSIVNPTNVNVPAWGTFDIPGGGSVQIIFNVDIAASVPAGVYQNPATATYTDPTRTVPNGTTTTNYDSGSSTGEDIEVIVPSTPTLGVVKSQTSTGPYVVGNTISYNIVVTNTGTVPLTGVTATDSSAIVGTCTPAQPTTLAPGASMTCPATHLVTQADVDNGSYVNTATGDSNETPPGTSTVTVPFAPAPALNVVKSQTSNGPYAVGSTITYSIVVTNTGNITLTGVTASDSSAVLGTCTPAQPATLAPGANMTCPATHVVTQADFNNGSYVNTATGDSNETPPGTSTVTVPLTPAPALSVLKSQTSTGPYVVGDTISYSIVVTNSGNVTLTGVTATDNSAILGTCTPAQPATLAPGANLTCAATHVVTQADINNGSYVNTATGDSNETPPDTSTVTVPFTPTPGLTVLKSQTSSGPYVVGDTIGYNIVVTNSGNVTLTGVTVNDSSAILGTCTPTQPATLAPGANLTCTATHVVTQADINNGSYVNTATGDSNETPPGTSTVTVPFAPAPTLNVVKRQTSNGPYVLGDTITYSIVVTNTGNVTLTGVTATDNTATVGTCTPAQPATLAPGANMTCPATHVVTQADISAGSYVNTATGDSNETPPGTSTVTVSFTVADLSLAKSVNNSTPAAGSTINFTLTVSNIGPDPATGVEVTDHLPSGYTYVSSTATQGTYNSATGIWTVGSMPVNSAQTLTIVVTVNAAGNHNNIGEVTAAIQVDPDSQPNNHNPAEDDQDNVAVTISGGPGPAQTPNPPSAGFLIPVSGFKANDVTDMRNVPQEKYSSTGDVTLEIPGLSVKISIVGVPKKNGTWNVAWLENEAGWLEGSAFPSWNGNSILTSHVYLASGLPGPFINLHKLKFGNKIVVHAYGQKYTFEVQTNTVVAANDQSVMKHEEKPWLTLITCKDYDEKLKTYKNRIVVRAVLVSVDWDK